MIWFVRCSLFLKMCVEAFVGSAVQQCKFSLEVCSTKIMYLFENVKFWQVNLSIIFRSFENQLNIKFYL